MHKIVLAAFIALMVASGCGKQGVPGAVGPQGPVGQTGASGAPGAPGVDAAPVTVVKLCQSCAPAYPNVFAEYAVCLQGQLYGVYSANGGFLALLPPGAYSSDGINCTCTLTVGANCQVTD